MSVKKYHQLMSIENRVSWHQVKIISISIRQKILSTKKLSRPTTTTLDWLNLTLNRWMSDLKWERWSWRESNWVLQVLQVHLGAETTAFWGASKTKSSFEDVSMIWVWPTLWWSETDEWGEGRRRQESKKFGGTSKIERCRFSWDDVVVVDFVAGRLVAIV